jgi:hypothetical protein
VRLAFVLVVKDPAAHGLSDVNSALIRSREICKRPRI